MTCRIIGCTKQQSTPKSTHLCGMHHQRLKRYGDPLYKSKYGTGHVDRNGYRILWRNNRLIPEHRFLWQQKFGPIPEDHVIHHKNANRLDNRFSNLELMGRGQHIRHHKLKEIDGQKPCSLCKQLKPVSEFYTCIRRSGKGKGAESRGSWCKSCHATQSRNCIDCNKPINRQATRCRSCHGGKISRNYWQSVHDVN